jgi:hypothetical protein
MAEFPITEAQITGLFIESVLFGVHLISVGYCTRALVSTRTRWKRADEISWAMLCVSLVLLANATFDVTLGFYHNLQAFVFYTGQGGAVQEFTDISNWINVSKSLTVVVQTMIGDAMLIYRCWIIYNRSWLVVAFSILLWLGCFASTIWVIFLEATLHSRVLVSASQLLPAGTTFWGLTISLNIITTTMIVWRIWKVDRSNKQTRIDSHSKGSHSSLHNVMRIVVESGLLYTATAFITFVTFVVGSNGVYVITDAEIQVVGIVFNMIIIRASALSKRAEGSTMESNRSASQTVPLEFVEPSSASATITDKKTEVHVLTPQYSLNALSKMDDKSQA